MNASGKVRTMESGFETLEQLEDDDWGEPQYDSYLVRTIYALRRKPIRDFTIEDLRITLGQEFGMEHLTPLALGRLEADPFAEGHCYPGDLLVSVMNLPPEYWAGHPAEASRMVQVAARVAAEIDRRDEIEDIKAGIREGLTRSRWIAA